MLRSHSKLDFIPEAYQCGGRLSTRPEGMTVTSYTLEYPWNVVCTLRVCLWEAFLVLKVKVKGVHMVLDRGTFLMFP